jgi:arylsulfatase A
MAIWQRMNRIGAMHLWAAIVLFATSASSLLASDTPKADAPKADTTKVDASQPESKQAHEPKRIMQGKDGSVVLQARDVVVHGKTVRYEPDKNTIGYWTKPDDWVSWELEIMHPDTFSVEMFEACGRGSGGSHYTVEIADQKLTDQVPDTDSFRNFRTRKIGQVKIDKPGNYTLSVRVDDKPGLAVMDLRTVTLKPVKAESPEPGKTDGKPIR